MESFCRGLKDDLTALGKAAERSKECMGELQGAGDDELRAVYRNPAERWERRAAARKVLEQRGGDLS